MSHTKKDVSPEEKCKNIQDTLQKEKSILQKMLNETENMHIVFLDRDFNIVRVNEAYAKTCGYKPEAMIGKNHFALYPDEEIEAIFKRVRDMGVPATFHDRPFVFPDQPEKGVTYWDWTLKPVKNEAGKVEGLVFSLVETTERKRAEEKLLQIQNRLSVATEAAKIGIHDYDIVANTVQWDKHIREIWGVEPDEPITYATFIENVHPDDRATVQAEMNKALDPEKGEFYAEYRVVNRKDKAVSWVYATGKTFFDDNHNAVRLVGTAEDITERKKAEEVLLKQAALIDLSPDGVVVKNFDDTVTFWSEGAEKLYGWTKEEATGTKIIDLLKPVYPHASSVEDVLKKLKVNGKWAGQLVHHAKDGHEIVVMSSWLAMVNKSGGMEILESNTDITEQMRLQTRLEEKAEEVEEYANSMEALAQNRLLQLRDAERLAAIGQTAGMVGHDIRNPLQSILGELYLAKTELSRIHEQDVKNNLAESITSIEKDISYINKIVEDLQDFAKPIKPVFQDVDLEDVFEALLLKAKIPEKVIASCCVEKETKLIAADPDMLRRVLRNLVNNAVQAMPQGGKLDIRAFKDADDLVITVEDTGVGISKEVAPMLFTPLFTTKSKGQGFGLAVVKRVTEALGGTVTFESKEGVGTKFILRFPSTKSSGN